MKADPDLMLSSGTTYVWISGAVGCNALGDLSSAVQGLVFAFFSGMPLASLRSRSIDPLDASIEPCPLPTDRRFSLRDRGALRSDPGQSQSGNSTLSPRACRAEARPPNRPYRRFDRSPLSMPLDTSVGAPSRGAKVLMLEVAGQIGGLRLLRSRSGLCSKG